MVIFGGLLFVVGCLMLLYTTIFEETIGILMSVFLIVISVTLISVDVTSPVEVSVKKVLITNSIEIMETTIDFEEVVEVTIWERKTMRRFAVSKNQKDFRYEVKRLTEKE